MAEKECYGRGECGGDCVMVEAYDTGEMVCACDAAEYMGEYFVTGSKGMNGYASEQATDAELAAYAAENMDDFMEFVKDNAALAVDKGNVRLETGRPAGEMLRRFANGDTFYDWLDYVRAGGGRPEHTGGI